MDSELKTSQYGILLRYHEIALKGENRGWFEERLAINARKLVQRALGADAQVEVTQMHSRLLLHADWNLKTRAAMNHVFGIANYSPVRFVETEKTAIAKAAIEETAKYIVAHGIPRSFRLKTRRSEKTFPESSHHLDREIGAQVKAAFPELVVNLDDPELIVGFELRKERSYLWTEKIEGPGGLPVGSNGRLLALLSGGLDSPVAAIRALRRGSPVSYVHFYGAPFVGEEVLEKIDDLVRKINLCQPNQEPLHLIPFGKIQERIALATSPKMRTLLYRRLMFRVACRLARKINAHALVTGESVGQVASQTVENLATIDAAATLPVLRPLISSDKQEIIDQAKRWETYEISIRPATDCCTLFADRHPALRATLDAVAEQEAKFPVEDLVEEALANAELRRVF